MDFDSIQNITIIGTGTMGPGTAICFANAGYSATLFGRKPSSLEMGQRGLDEALHHYRVHGLDGNSEEAIRSNLKLTTDPGVAFGAAHLVFETVPEVIGTKHDALQGLDKNGCPPNAIIASNTSSLDLSHISEVLSEERLSYFVGMHLFMPSALNPFVEIVPSTHTSPQTVDASLELMYAIGKEPARLKRPINGYIVNRIQAAMWWSAYDLLEHGLKAHEIDEAVKRTLGRDLETKNLLDIGQYFGKDAYIANTVLFGMQHAANELIRIGIATPEGANNAVKLTIALRLPVVGPIKRADMTGLDTVASILVSVGHTIPAPLATALAAGHLGVKTGKKVTTGQGIYTWPLEEQHRVDQQLTAKIIDHHKRKHAAGHHHTRPKRHSPHERRRPHFVLGASLKVA